MTVLIVEDDAAQVRLMSRVLATAGAGGFTVRTAGTLAQAVNLLRGDGGIDVVLLDLGLPDSRGIDTVRRLHAKAPHVPIVVLTGHGDHELAEQAVLEGAQDYLAKGEATPQEIVRAMRYSLERQRAQAAARESEERFRLLVEGVKDYAILMLDADGRVLSWNDGAARIFGYDEAEVVGRHIRDLARITHEPPPGEGPVIDCERLLRDAVVHGRAEDEGWRGRRDGSRFWADVSLTRLDDGSGRLRGFAAVTRDVTERKRAQDELMDYQDRLRRLAAQLSVAEERERRRFAVQLHDNVGQPLAAAQIRIDTLPPDARAGCGESLLVVRELLTEAIDSVRALTSDISPPVLYDVGLAAAVESLAAQVRRRHGLDVTVCCAADLPPLPHELRGLLFQVVRELLINVVKHARARGVTVTLDRVAAAAAAAPRAARPSGDGGADLVRVTVADDGAGFDPAGVRARAGPAEGFGLFNLRERLAAALGTLNVTSAPGRGTRVEAEVPLDAPLPPS